MSKKKSGHRPEGEGEEYFFNGINLSLNNFLRTEDEEGKLPTGTTS